ncbi:MAG: pyrrolo-quinoline quinone [Betaproteobacteria bacterium]|nr:MAG: pyrrolo-quinoline quinone [Betaproteobacteria bacterium]
MRDTRLLPDLRYRLGRLLSFALLGAVSLSSSLAGANPSMKATPDAQTLLDAARSDDWLLPARSYLGNRYSTLSQITPENVGTLGLAWETQISDDGQQEASPIVTNGTMYISTPHDNVLALDARTGKLKWQFPYNPPVISFAVSRGVGIEDGKVFLGTQDCRVIALNAETGKTVWDVPGCRDSVNSFFSMASYVYKGSVILGTGGGDNGNQGRVSAFSVVDGKKLWDWDTIKRDTWPGKSWVHGGTDVWSGVAINPDTNTLFVAPGNAGPDMVLKGREGEDLYSNSIVALDISGKTPRVKWHYQLLKDDTHDADPAMVPVLFSGKVAGTARDLVGIGDKSGNFFIFEQANGELIHRLTLSKQEGLDTPPTPEGIPGCPNHGGGIEWLGGAYDPNSNLFVVGSTNECGIWKLLTEHPEYIPGQAYKGGALPKRGNGTGVLSAVDVDTGNVRWKAQVPYPAQGGALITATGLVFTSDLGGSVYALDVATGKELWKTNTGSSICAPFSTYMLDGDQYLTILVGQAGNQQTANLPATHGSHVLVYKLGATQTVVNGTEGQTPMAAIPPSAASAQIAGTGSAPYTKEQVVRGQTVYSGQCAVCHGDKLQGISAPALTGPSFAKSHLNVSQIRSVVATQMPLTAPGSLTPDDYASVMAYMLSYDCVKPAGNGSKPFPPADDPALTKVTIGAKTCSSEAH